MKRSLLLIALFVVLSSSCFSLEPIRQVSGYKTQLYDVLFNPYPIPIDKDVNIRVSVPYEPISVTYVFDKDTKYQLSKEDNAWTGVIKSPKQYQEGWNLSFVYIKYRKADLDKAATQKIMDFFRKMFAAIKLTEYSDYVLIEGKIWIRAYKEIKLESFLTSSSAEAYKELTLIATIEPTITTETIQSAEASATSEASALKVKGSKTINFVTKSIEGSKEGFVPGMTREESLRANISGKIDSETDVDATFISTSTMGTTTTSMNEDKVSILVRRASTEVYYGDFIGDMNETEFARMNKSLSGIKVTGNYEKWGFKALYSTPRGQVKYFRSYGNGTQGPYQLGASPVVVDSDKVYLDGVEQVRGDDYTIDYQAGNITFRKGTVLTTSIIEAYFDWRETLYQHSTMALRYKQQVNDDLKLGVTYLDDSDSLYKAGEIRDTLTATIEPQSHIVIGMDGSGRIGNTAIDSEIAYSKMNLNLLDQDRNIQEGKAFKISTATSQGPFNLLTRYKRVGPLFTAVGDSAPKQDESDYGGTLGWRPTTDYYAEADYANDKYKQLGTEYLISDKGLKSKYTPENIPTLNYFYRETEDSNDPVLGTKISRLTTKNNAETSYKYSGFLVSTLQGGIEERVNRYPSQEVTTYKTANFGTATYGLDKISAAGNVELKDSAFPDKTSSLTRTYNANVAITPDTRYFGSLAMQLIDDSLAGNTNVTDLNYRASPTDNFSTDGKYTITSVKEDFNGTPEAVTKQVGSFKLDYRPINIVRCKYYFKPNFTRLNDTNSYSFSDFIHQGELMYTPIREISTGLIYKTDDMMNIDKSDTHFKREANRKNTYDTTLLLKSAPMPFLSLELSYLTGDLALTEQVSTGATSYYRTLGNTKQYDLNAKTSLSERFSVDSKYTWQNQYQSSDQLTSDQDTLSQTIFLKGTWNYNDNWLLYASYSYSESVNRLVIVDDLTFTVSPGVGITYRIMEIFRTDFEYTRSDSYGASNAEVDTYSLKTKYDPNEYVHVYLRGTREIAVDPDYKSSEIMGSLELVI